MPMMNSEARKRAQSASNTDTTADPLSGAARLADCWDREADREDERGNEIAAVILHAHADELRAAMSVGRLSA